MVNSELPLDAQFLGKRRLVKLSAMRFGHGKSFLDFAGRERDRVGNRFYTMNFFLISVLETVDFVVEKDLRPAHICHEPVSVHSVGINGQSFGEESEIVPTHFSASRKVKTEIVANNICVLVNFTSERTSKEH